MESFVQGVYLREVETQCRFAISAAHNLNHALRDLGKQAPGADRRILAHAEVFRQIHSLLTHASNVSRLLWPIAPRRRAHEDESAYVKRIGDKGHDRVQRGVELRRLLGLADSGVLSNRTLRDHLEHFDERLDEWRATSKNRLIANDLIGPKNIVSGLDQSEMMRWYDPQSLIFRFRGEEHDIQGIVSAIDALLPNVIRVQEELWNAQVSSSTSRV